MWKWMVELEIDREGIHDRNKWRRHVMKRKYIKENISCTIFLNNFVSTEDKYYTLTKCVTIKDVEMSEVKFAYKKHGYSYPLFRGIVT